MIVDVLYVLFVLFKEAERYAAIWENGIGVGFVGKYMLQFVKAMS